MPAVFDLAKESLEDGFNSGRAVVGESEQALAGAWPVRKHVVVRADDDNSSTISIGTKGNSAAGFILAAGDTSPRIYLDDLSKIFLTGGAAGQNYSWLSN